MGKDREHLETELLVMGAQDGDSRAMETLVRRWQERLWLHARRLTGDGEAAWDITQDAWLAVIRGLWRLNDPVRFRPWIYRIVTNKAMDYLRKRPAETQLGEPAQPGAEGDDNDSDLLHCLLARLDATKRLVLSLYYLEELSIAEIGEMLRIPAGTVKSRLHHARGELRALWERHDR
jgi:RNA polymerase sigma factor (sigma-70 family)